MKYKAIWAYIKDEIECHNGNDNVVIPKEILKVCVESLEKQTPKKVNNADGFGGRCPVCGYYIAKIIYSSKECKYCPEYCPECGQAIDWEVKE